MKRNVHVLFFIGDLTPGGSESHLVRLIQGFDRTRVRPELMVLRMRGALIDDVRASGVPIHEVESDRSEGGPLRRLMRIRGMVRALRPDVVHSYGFPCDFYAPLATMPHGGMRVVTSRRGNQERARIRFLYRMTNPFVDKVLCVSRATEEFSRRTEGLSPRQSAVIPNGIDVDAFARLGSPERPLRTLGTVGRLRSVKGTDLLLEAFGRLGRPGLSLRIGGPADSPWGVALIEANRLRPGVAFEGDVQEVPSFLEQLDLFVLPSRSEGMSNALLEAMAAGLPIVATDVGSNSEVLEGGAAGLLVRPDAASLAEGIARLLDDPERARELGRAARRRVEVEYSLPAMVRRYETFYEELVS